MTATKPGHRRRRKLAPSTASSGYEELRRTGQRQELRFPGPIEQPRWREEFWAREREARHRIPPNSKEEVDFITQAVLQRLRIRGRDVEWLVSDGSWELADELGPYRSRWLDHYVRNFVRHVLEVRGHPRRQTLLHSRRILNAVLDFIDAMAEV